VVVNLARRAGRLVKLVGRSVRRVPRLLFR
jgi:hypothetical protein